MRRLRVALRLQETSLEWWPAAGRREGWGWRWRLLFVLAQGRHVVCDAPPVREGFEHEVVHEARAAFFIVDDLNAEPLRGCDGRCDGLCDTAGTRSEGSRQAVGVRIIRATRRCLFRTLGGAWPLQQAAGLAKRLLWREPAESGPGFVDVRDGMRVLGGAAHHLKDRTTRNAAL